MIAQQTNLDTIANNLANVNTQGYKTHVNEFKTLLYQNLQTRTTTANGEQKPTSAQVGLGVRNSAITTIFRQGNAMASDSDTARCGGRTAILTTPATAISSSPWPPTATCWPMRTGFR